MDCYGMVETDYRPNGFDPVDFEVTLLEPRPFRPFKSSEEYLYAMKEDLAEWLTGLYEGLHLEADNFLEQLETGVVLCQHANYVVRKAREYYRTIGGPCEMPIPDRDVVYRSDVLPETFHARDNVSNFISWCRALSIKECLLFETDDLVLRKNERSFILCLLEVARRGAQFGMPAPLLVQFEQEIDAELANDDGYLMATDYHPPPQVVTNDLRSLHERVVELLSRCTCPSQFPMIRVADGKYRIGDTKVLIFVRILRSHVMVRVGGGWDTLEHYLDKHDPCRCRSGHRLATSAKLTMHQGKSNIPSMHVTYHRPPQPPSTTPTSSPINHRRQIPYGGHITRTDSPPRSQQIATAAAATPAQQCSDDESSASNPSLHDRRKKSTTKQEVRRKHSAGSTSEDLSEDEDQPTEMSSRSPVSRKRIANRESLRGTVPSSWQYTPGGRERKGSDHSPPASHQRKISSQGKAVTPATATRLPALTTRSQNQSPPRVVKVSPRVQYQQPKWPEQRSQSSEDLYPAVMDTKLVFHSRGTSPVNLKGRQNSTNGFGTPKDYTPSDANGAFRRADPVRHSSYHSPRIYTKKSPPRPPPRPAPARDSKRTTVSVARGCSPPERQQQQLKHANDNSPVLQKLMERSDLCSDENFLKKIETLINEYESSLAKRASLDDNSCPRSLPVDLQEKISSLCHPRRSPKDVDARSPSKIPLPTWQ